ncbi:hypothetical protein KJ750_00925 [Patescibacteria group bacterium]|nr:hypothetical protein [Patescibacteria group bacterium]
MEIQFTKSFEKDYKNLSREIQKRLDKQLIFLLENFQYPSLRIKKIEGHSEIWEGRVSKDYRFTFQIGRSIYFIRRAGTHDILRRP